MKILDIAYDQVIKSYYLTVKTDYNFALDKLVPLISKLDFQRNTLKSTFYNRLKDDILTGCVIPPLTIAYKIDIINSEQLNEEFIRNNLSSAFVLDGIQRLNTISTISENPMFPGDKPLYLHILICNSMNKLLYRMITLNNGQKPMTARHQIETLASNIIDFDSLPILTYTEKNKNIKSRSDDNTMSREVIIKGYLAFISNSINIDNQKIIESKMDELIADKILEASLPTQNTEYTQIIEYINLQLHNPFIRDWFLVPNNFIGFSAAMSTNYNLIKLIDTEALENALNVFEKSFTSFNASKIKLGTARRKMVMYFFGNYSELSLLSENQLLDIISQVI